MAVFWIVKTLVYRFVATNSPPPLPFEDVLLVINPLEIVELPFKLRIPIAPPFD